MAAKARTQRLPTGSRLRFPSDLRIAIAPAFPARDVVERASGAPARRSPWRLARIVQALTHYFRIRSTHKGFQSAGLEDERQLFAAIRTFRYHVVAAEVEGFRGRYVIHSASCLGGRFVKILEHWCWTYFPHVDPAAFRGGIHARPNARQGLRHAVLAGEIMRFPRSGAWRIIPDRS